MLEIYSMVHEQRHLCIFQFVFEIKPHLYKRIGFLVMTV